MHTYVVLHISTISQELADLLKYRKIALQKHRRRVEEARNRSLPDEVEKTSLEHRMWNEQTRQCRHARQSAD